MGYKHTELNQLKFGSIHKGKSYSKTLDINIVKKPVIVDMWPTAILIPYPN